MKNTPNDAADETSLDQNHVQKVKDACDKYDDDKQMQFYEMLRVLNDHGYFANVLPYSHDALPVATSTMLQWFIDRYVNTDLYNISPKALATKAMLPPSYMPTPVCETGWLVVENDEELPVPAENGEFFIGWVIETQPMFESLNDDTMIRQSIVSPEKLQKVVSSGYALHQGPGLIYMTCGDFAHGGTQEPYILEHNYEAVKQTNEHVDEFKSRMRSQAPAVHWRLDAPSVIHKSLLMGAVTEANVGAGQLALASIGTQTPRGTRSRSQNFLGENYQTLLANPNMIAQLVDTAPGPNEVYEVEDAKNSLFIYGSNQQSQGGSYR